MEGVGAELKLLSGTSSKVWEKRIEFKVDIANIIAIMGQSLYSRAETPIRELIQNAHDAIARRRQIEINFVGRIDVVQDAKAGSLKFTDDGIGLTPDEAEKYLGTLGVGVTGLLKGRGSEEDRAQVSGSSSGLIGQFGIGLFSGFMLADLVSVESMSSKGEDSILWSAGAGTEIHLRQTNRETIGTTVELKLKDEYRVLAEDEEILERAIKEFADFIDIPIHLNGSQARINLINAAWFEQTPDPESIESELSAYFDEHPLDVIPIRCEKPVSIAGAVYISPQRTPGFDDDATVSVTVRRMVISRNVQDLLPTWGSFFRGVLELHDCSPTASREDLVRDANFTAVQNHLEDFLYQHFEKQAEENPRVLEAVVDAHRYTFAGTAHAHPRLRKILRQVYRWNTSKGRLTFDEILKQSQADPLFEPEADVVVWYNADRRQERWMNSLFEDQTTLCVHTTRSFEETLLAEMMSDVTGFQAELRMATLSAPNFESAILKLQDTEDADPQWQEFFKETEALVKFAESETDQPVIAFLNERFELFQSIEDMKQDGHIPLGFQRLIDSHFQGVTIGKNEVVLNRRHRLVRSALEGSPRHPLASVLRIIVINALASAGASIGKDLQKQQKDDLNWIAEALEKPD